MLLSLRSLSIIDVYQAAGGSPVVSPMCASGIDRLLIQDVA
jgi:hypothetical protein